MSRILCDVIIKSSNLYHEVANALKEPCGGTSCMGMHGRKCNEFWIMNGEWMVV